MAGGTLVFPEYDVSAAMLATIRVILLDIASFQIGLEDDPAGSPHSDHSVKNAVIPTFPVYAPDRERIANPERSVAGISSSEPGTATQR